MPGGFRIPLSKYLDVPRNKQVIFRRKNQHIATKVENLKRQNEYDLITALNNVVKIHYIKAKSDHTQQNSKSRSYGYRNETVNHIVNESRKVNQSEGKTRHD